MSETEPIEKRCLTLRAPNTTELPAASALCLQSKAQWGYGPDFIEACREELTLSASDLAESEVVAAVLAEAMIGVAQVSTDGDQAELDKLFIEPGLIGHGVGRILFDWACERAREAQVNQMIVTADPDAVAFYEKMGFRQFSEEPSGSIPGRMLPVLSLAL